MSHFWSIFLAFALCGVANAGLPTLPAPDKKTVKPVMAFDLGKTLVDHTHFVPDETGEIPGAFDELWYYPGVRDYLINLRSQGYPIAMMINIPESWGATQEDKLNTLKKSVAKSWKNTIASGKNAKGSKFDWELFDFIVLPLNDKQRKGKCQFENGVPQDCNLEFYDRFLAKSKELFATTEIIYQSENPVELDEAEYKGFCVRSTMNPEDPDFLLPLNEVADYHDQCRSKTLPAPTTNKK